MSNIFSSILDFPRKTLSEDLWKYESKQDLPTLNPDLRFVILSNAEKNLVPLGLNLKHCNLYGGSASYQWSYGTDIDVSLYASGWSDTISSNDVEKYQSNFKKSEIPYNGYVIHFFLKPPQDIEVEISDAVYDVFNEQWILPPLILPPEFDPDEYFKPFIRHAEQKAKKLDIDIGKLRRSWKILEKSSSALENSKEPDLVKDRIENEKQTIRVLFEKLANEFENVRNRRYALHDKLKEKMKENKNIGRFDRFQEPEIVWKYLDRSGYNDFLHKIYKVQTTNSLEKILNKYG